MLHNPPHGKALTEKQRKYFGYLSSLNLGGKMSNENISTVSYPQGFVGVGYNNTGRKYSPAWGGQFQMGGNIPGTLGFTYARTGSTPSNGKYAKKTKPSAKNGIQTYFQHGLDFKTKGMQDGGFVDKLKALKSRNSKRDSVRQTLYDKYPHDYQKVNNGMLNYFQQEKVINDNKGQYNHPGKVTKINSPNITMQGINYPVLGISSETNEKKLMLPNNNYLFNNTKSVVEYPLMNKPYYKNGGIVEGEYDIDLTESEIKHLKKQGYKVDFI